MNRTDGYISSDHETFFWCRNSPRMGSIVTEFSATPISMHLLGLKHDKPYLVPTSIAQCRQRLGQYLTPVVVTGGQTTSPPLVVGVKRGQ